MYCSRDKVRKLLVLKCLGIHDIAYTNGGNEKVNLPYLAGLAVKKYFRLVTDPVDVDLLAGNAFDNHADSFGTVVLFYELFEIVAVLSVLIPDRTLFLILQPHVEKICLAKIDLFKLLNMTSGLCPASFTRNFVVLCTSSKLLLTEITIPRCFL